MKLPPIPKVVHSLLGPIPVTIVEKLVAKETPPVECMGIYYPWERRIDILTCHPIAMWHTLHHETFHVMLIDAGCQLPEPVVEYLCDCYATWKVSEFLAK